VCVDDEERVGQRVDERRQVRALVAQVGQLFLRLRCDDVETTGEQPQVLGAARRRANVPLPRRHALGRGR
jgi:hypothetical protein